MQNFYFDSNGFMDPPEVLEENINGIGGAGLASLMRDALIENGLKCGEVFAEDYGWAFNTYFDDTSYFCTASVDPIEEEEQESFQFFVNINVDKKRSFFEKLLGKNKIATDDNAVKVVREMLSSHADVQGLKSSSD